jgi:hypothetical protein
MYCNVNQGSAKLEGMKSYGFTTVLLGNTSLHIEPAKLDYSEVGPYFGFNQINSGLLQSTLMHFEFSTSSPAIFNFDGPKLGYVRAASGHSAAENSGHGRPIERLTAAINLNTQGLTVHLQGVCGSIYLNDCCGSCERVTTKTFEVGFTIGLEFLPTVVDLRSAKNTFENCILEQIKA